MQSIVVQSSQTICCLIKPFSFLLDPILCYLEQTLGRSTKQVPLDEILGYWKKVPDIGKNLSEQEGINGFGERLLQYWTEFFCFARQYHRITCWHRILWQGTDYSFQMLTGYSGMATLSKKDDFFHDSMELKKTKRYFFVLST